jgi:breast cancer 2 susceptibility protein
LQPGKAKPATLMPSAEALAKAAKQLAQWDKEFDDESADPSLVDELLGESTVSFKGFASAAGAFRPASDDLENPFSVRQPPGTPSPAGPSGFRSFSPLVPLDKKKEFKPPFLVKPATQIKQTTADYSGSPLKPKRTVETRGFVVPTRIAGPSTPLRPTTPLSPPRKSLGITPRRVVGNSAKKPAFNTPFKAGMKPGEAGRVALDAARAAKTAVHVIGSGRMPSVPSSSKNKGKGRATDLDFGERNKNKTCQWD